MTNIIINGSCSFTYIYIYILANTKYESHVSLRAVINLRRADKTVHIDDGQAGQLVVYVKSWINTAFRAIPTWSPTCWSLLTSRLPPWHPLCSATCCSPPGTGSLDSSQPFLGYLLRSLDLYAFVSSCCQTMQHVILNHGWDIPKQAAGCNKFPPMFRAFRSSGQITHTQWIVQLTVAWGQCESIWWFGSCTAKGMNNIDPVCCGKHAGLCHTNNSQVHPLQAILGTPWEHPPFFLGKSTSHCLAGPAPRAKRRWMGCWMHFLCTLGACPRQQPTWTKKVVIWQQLVCGCVSAPYLQVQTNLSVRLGSRLSTKWGSYEIRSRTGALSNSTCWLLSLYGYRFRFVRADIPGNVCRHHPSGSMPIALSTAWRRICIWVRTVQFRSSCHMICKLKTCSGATCHRLLTGCGRGLLANVFPAFALLLNISKLKTTLGEGSAPSYVRVACEHAFCG